MSESCEINLLDLSSWELPSYEAIPKLFLNLKKYVKKKREF